MFDGLTPCLCNIPVLLCDLTVCLALKSFHLTDCNVYLAGIYTVLAVSLLVVDY